MKRYTRKEKVIEQTPLYKIYLIDGVYFMQDYTMSPDTRICGYDTLASAREGAYYAGLRDSK